MKVLIVDDDPDIQEVVSLCFEIRWPGVEVFCAPDGATGLLRFQQDFPDLVVLDLGLPDMDGLTVCQQMKKLRAEVPVVILTVRSKSEDVVQGLTTGADEYIKKPFDELEFITRLQTVLRRTSKAAESGVLAFPEARLTIDPEEREVILGGALVPLTKIEYGLLFHLASNRGKVMTYNDLLSRVWGDEVLGTNAETLLKAHVQHLRENLGDDSDEPRLIRTVRGIGYEFLPKG